MIWHVIPENDLYSHQEKSTCHCQPEASNVNESGDMVIVHNSFDGMEAVEFANDILNNYE